MITKQQAWGLGVIATAIAIVSSSLALWPTIGWETPSAHAADIIEVAADHTMAQEAVLDAIKESRDEWKCDEYDEELLDALQDQAIEDNVTIRRKIEKLREKMQKLDCQRFEDFG